MITELSLCLPQSQCYNANQTKGDRRLIMAVRFLMIAYNVTWQGMACVFDGDVDGDVDIPSSDCRLTANYHHSREATDNQS